MRGPFHVRAPGGADYLAPMESKRRDQWDTVRGPGPLGMRLLVLLAVPLAVLPTACAEEGERRETSPAESLVAVRDLRVGGAIDSSGAVIAPADSFAPDDTVYASVFAEGQVDQVILTARWTRAGDVLVGEEQEVFPLEGRRVVTFPLTKEAGLPPGEYQVVIRLATDEIGTRAFTVVDPASTIDREKEPER